MDIHKTLPGNRQNPLRRKKVMHEGDRRVYARIPTIKVIARVKIKPTVLRPTHWEEVDMIDYSRSGFAFASKNKFKLGQSLKVFIHLTVEDTDIVLKDIFGSIKSVMLEENNTLRFGVAFNFEANDYMQSKQVKAKLIGIERMVLRAIAYQITRTKGRSK